MSDKSCNKCHCKNDSTRYFCKKCGAILSSNNFSNHEVYDLCETKIMRIIDNLQHTPHTPVVWNDVVDIYTNKVERFKALFNIPEMGAENNTGICDKMNDFLDLCHNPDFQIAFVGTIKTGKSTLINSLLGHNYASMAVTPETAALTKFRSSNKDYINVIFYSTEEWKELWASRSSAADAFMKEYNELCAEEQREKWVGHEPIRKELANCEIEEELQIWSSSKRAEHYFVKEVEVGISNLPEDFPKQVIFVDTPGLSDPVGYRSEITKQYIRKANAVFVCVDAQKLQKEEIETISSVFSFSSYNKNKVHIIATHWDKLNNPEEDWVEQKKWMMSRLCGKGFYDDANMAEENIMHSAAYIYNLCRDVVYTNDSNIKSLKQFGLNYDIDPKSIMNKLPFLMEKSNIGKIKQVIQDKLVANYKSLLATDIERKYFDIKYSLKRIAEENREAMSELVELSSSDLLQLEQKVLQQKKHYKDVQQCQKQLTAVLENVRKSTQDRLATVKATLSKYKEQSLKDK